MSIKERLKKIEEDLYVDDYLHSLDRYNTEERILKFDAVSFLKIDDGCYYPIIKKYTSKENYKKYKKVIDAFELGVKEYVKKQDI
jgi:hypothetical protein